MSNGTQLNTHQLIVKIGAGILALILLFNVYLVWRNIGLHRQTYSKSIRIQQIEMQVRDWQQLFQELLAYGSRQPALDPILQKYGLKSGGTVVAPTSKAR